MLHLFLYCACYRGLVTDAPLPYLKSITNNYGGFLHAQSVTELLLHVATSINVPMGAHALRLNQSMLLFSASCK
jgi:hypothetical protein